MVCITSILLVFKLFMTDKMYADDNTEKQMKYVGLLTKENGYKIKVYWVVFDGKNINWSMLATCSSTQTLPT
jgi:hypothetical protein